ncbi:MAG: hypothetical protein IJA55_10110 [Clostridia bacterium]|nr:hypothetical protein [Clostridia bacterium]
MQLFCAKCGAKLDERTGKCPRCSTVHNMPTANKPQGVPEYNHVAINSNTENKQSFFVEVKPNRKKNTKFQLSYVLAVSVFVILIGILCVLVFKNFFNPHKNKPDRDGMDTEYPIATDTDEITIEQDTLLPAVDVDDELSHNGSDIPDTDETEKSEYKDGDDDTAEPDDDPDLEHIHSSIVAVGASSTLSTEKEAYDHFKARGFSKIDIFYEYSIYGEYVGENKISRKSNEIHPVYKADYITPDGEIWLIREINGRFFAVPVMYNAEHVHNPAIIVSESDRVIEYNNITNSFYTIAPDTTWNSVITVEKIDAETLDDLDL